MVLKFVESLDSVAECIEKDENDNGVHYTRRSVSKSFGADSKLARSILHVHRWSCR